MLRKAYQETMFMQRWLVRQVLWWLIIVSILVPVAIAITVTLLLAQACGLWSPSR